MHKSFPDQILLLILPEVTLEDQLISYGTPVPAVPVNTLFSSARPVTCPFGPGANQCEKLMLRSPAPVAIMVELASTSRFRVSEVAMQMVGGHPA